MNLEPLTFTRNGNDIRTEKLIWTTHQWPAQTGIYLTLTFTMGCWRYPRLYRIWRTRKSGKLYCCQSDTIPQRRRQKIESEFFNTAWIKVEPPDKCDWKPEIPLGGEWQ